MWHYNYDYLCHHGIKGQRWGVRRFQNKDGTLTPAGRRRQAKLEKKLDKISPKEAQQKAENNSPFDKSLSEYSTEELRAMSDRLRAEREYKSQLNPQPITQANFNDNVEKGKKFIEKVDTLQKNVGTLSNLVNNGSKLYDGIAKVSNTFFNTNMPIISQKKDEKKKKQNDSNDDDE